MFAYCLNNPINFTDSDGENADSLQAWITSMWWLVGADQLLIFGDLIYIGGIVIFGLASIYTMVEITEIVSVKAETKSEPEPPDVTYPGNNPAEAPDGYEWRGKGEQGSNEGSYYNPETGESLHPDLNHPDGLPPHWDYNYRGSGGKGWRIFIDGTIGIKK